MSCPETERFVKNWNRIHKQTSRVLRAASQQRLQWQPNERLRTLGDLINHFPQAELFIVRTALAGSTQKTQLDLSNHTVDEIVGLFDSQHEQLVEEVSKLTREQLDEEVEFYGRKMRRIILLWGMTEHEIHHRGQLFTYYRLAGVEPPDLRD